MLILIIVSNKFKISLYKVHKQLVFHKLIVKFQNDKIGSHNFIVKSKPNRLTKKTLIIN